MLGGVVTSLLKCLVYGCDHSDMQFVVEDIERGLQSATDILAVLSLPKAVLLNILVALRRLNTGNATTEWRLSSVCGRAR